METLEDRYLISEETSGKKRTKIYAVRKHGERGVYIETVTETPNKDGKPGDSKKSTKYYPHGHLSARRVDGKEIHKFIKGE